jgi:hypothetical protein
LKGERELLEHRPLRGGVHEEEGAHDERSH